MDNPFDYIENRLSRIESLLLNLHNEVVNTPASSNLSTDKLLTVEEAAHFLNLAIPTIYSLVQRRVLPAAKRGKRWYFSQKELSEWVMEGRQKTIKQIEADAENYVERVKKGGR